MDILEELKNTKIGTKMKIKMENNFGTECFEKVKYFGQIQQDGWIHKSGAWCLYEIPGVIEKCYSVLFKPYKKQKLYRIKIGFELKSFEIGWDQAKTVAERVKTMRIIQVINKTFENEKVYTGKDKDNNSISIYKNETGILKKDGIKKK